MMNKTQKSILLLPTPMNISYKWNYGSLIGIMLALQVLTGFIISMHYSASASTAFASISHINREINNGWLIRMLHANGASMIFILMYMHVGRNIYYKSYKLISTWISGVLMLLMMMASAFLGYVLPWGQMSFWGATVITNLMSAIPYCGTTMTYWLWGGFAIDSATLTRFFSLHFMIPLIIIMMVMLHLMMLHTSGSSNPMGTTSNLEKIPFHPYFTWKDTITLIIIMMMLSLLSLISPYYLCDPDNFSPANPMNTPPHIQPEWYFLFAYAILRSIPNKLGGVIALMMSLLILLMMPIMSHKNKPLNWNPLIKMLFWSFTSLFMLLTFMGASPVEPPYVMLSQIMSSLYFMYYMVSTKL